MSAVTLHGGPADGRVLGDVFGVRVAVPEYVPPKRRPTDEDRFYVNPFRYVDPDCNPTFIRHMYDARSGQYLGVES